MKTKIYILLMVLGVSTLLAGSIKLDEFSAKTDGNSVTLSWMAPSEGEIAKYEIQRSCESSAFSVIGEKQASGAGIRYEFIDNTVVFSKDGSDDDDKLLGKKNYSYRLNFILKDGSSSLYDQTVTAELEVNSVKNTWGMIKEMFR
ncbi:MAG: hypothetical protein KAH48_08700 [Chlorobi bacterium]|nr:hypothetical protein [Chlorobiota bacterium]